MHIVMVTPFVDKAGRIDGGVAGVSKYLSDEFVKKEDIKITIVVPNAARNQVEQFGNITIYRIAKAIEWHKHQSPRRWIDIFSQAGYSLYDFRASGSGNIDYDISKINTKCVAIAFEVAGKLKSQSMVFDFVEDENSNPLIAEASYGYLAIAVKACSGY